MRIPWDGTTITNMRFLAASNMTLFFARVISELNSFLSDIIKQLIAYAIVDIEVGDVF